MKATFPKLRRYIEKTSANTPGNNPTTAVTHNKRKYAIGDGKPAYVIGAKVSHQQVPVKKTNPQIQPRMNERPADAFSRSMAQNKGTGAIHARNQNSKSGKARMRSIEESMASAAFFLSGKSRVSRGNFMRTV